MNISVLCQIQSEKIEYLKDYITINEMINQAAKTSNTFDLQALNIRKKRLIEAVEMLDNRFLESFKQIKSALNLKDLSQASVSDYPELGALKLISGETLKLLVEAKRSDEALKSAIDSVYAHLKGSTRPIDLNRMYAYTQTYFNETEE